MTALDEKYTRARSLLGWPESSHCASMYYCNYAVEFQNALNFRTKFLQKLLISPPKHLRVKKRSQVKTKILTWRSIDVNIWWAKWFLQAADLTWVKSLAVMLHKLLLNTRARGSLRFGGSQICFGRSCDGRTEFLDKTREFGKLAWYYWVLGRRKGEQW